MMLWVRTRGTNWEFRSPRELGLCRPRSDIYVSRGLDAVLAAKVAEQLMTHDALGSHARDELGISVASRARPLQAEIGHLCQPRTRRGASREGRRATHDA